MFSHTNRQSHTHSYAKPHTLLIRIKKRIVNTFFDTDSKIDTGWYIEVEVNKQCARACRTMFAFDQKAFNYTTRRLFEEKKLFGAVMPEDAHSVVLWQPAFFVTRSEQFIMCISGYHPFVLRGVMSSVFDPDDPEEVSLMRVALPAPDEDNEDLVNATHAVMNTNDVTTIPEAQRDFFITVRKLVLKHINIILASPLLIGGNLYAVKPTQDMDMDDVAKLFASARESMQGHHALYPTWEFTFRLISYGAIVARFESFKARMATMQVMKRAWETRRGVPPDGITDALSRALFLRRFCRVRGVDAEDMETEVVEPFARDIVRFL